MERVVQSGNGTRSGLWVSGTIAVVFGIATIVSGGRVIFGGGRAEAGNVVDFVLWFNFLAGFAYIVAGVGLWMRRRWAAWLAIVITVATALVFLAFGVHVALGGAWERRTVVAMTLRTLVWAGIAAIAWRRSAANAPVAREH